MEYSSHIISIWDVQFLRKQYQMENILLELENSWFHLYQLRFIRHSTPPHTQIRWRRPDCPSQRRHIGRHRWPSLSDWPPLWWTSCHPDITSKCTPRGTHARPYPCCLFRITVCCYENDPHCKGSFLRRIQQRLDMGCSFVWLWLEPWGRWSNNSILVLRTGIRCFVNFRWCRGRRIEYNVCWFIFSDVWFLFHGSKWRMGEVIMGSMQIRCPTKAWSFLVVIYPLGRFSLQFQWC